MTEKKDCHLPLCFLRKEFRLQMVYIVCGWILVSLLGAWACSSGLRSLVKSSCSNFTSHFLERFGTVISCSRSLKFVMLLLLNTEVVRVAFGC
jgi:hypothetical protein